MGLYFVAESRRDHGFTSMVLCSRLLACCPSSRARRSSCARGHPDKPLVTYQVLPTTPWMDPSSTGEPRRWGALNKTG
jgi:hypothetical protein